MKFSRYCVVLAAKRWRHTLFGMALWSAGLAFAAPFSLQGTLALSEGDASDRFSYVFVLQSASNIVIQSYGFGGSSNAAGGRNLAGAAVPAGGFDPYVSLFSGSGPQATFVASSDDGSCPPATMHAGLCNDSRVTLMLAAGIYTVVVSSFGNMSIAENYGFGTLGDGFVEIGAFDPARTNAFAIDIAISPVVVKSRKTHGAAGTFDLSLDTTQPISGPVTVEPRAIGGGHTLVFPFDSAITSTGTLQR